MTPDDIDGDIRAYIDEVCREDDRIRAERRAEGAPPVRENRADGILHRQQENNALATTAAAYTPKEEPRSGGFYQAFVELLGEVVSDERWREREEVQEALAPLRKEITALREELAELRGFANAVRGISAPERWFKLRGEYREGGTYNRLDIVSRDGAWWVAKCDDAGVGPGQDWVRGPVGESGEKGARGERGLRGSKGAPGRDAPKFTAFDIDRANYRVIAKMSDGAEMTLELRSLFEQFLAEVGE